jgi:hypothetical protein
MVEEQAPTQANKETMDSLCASAIGAPATFKSSVPTNWKKKEQYAYGLLGMSSLKKRAVWHD